MNMMSEASHYTVDEDINDDSYVGLVKDSLRLSDNDSSGGHGGGNLGFDNSNEFFAIDSNDTVDDDDLHVWST